MSDRSDGASGLRYNGSSWSMSTVPETFLGLQVDHIWALNPTVAWATGDPALNPMKWNGTEWKNDYSIKYDTPPVGIWGGGERDVWVATSTGVYHYDGTSWGKDPSITSTGSFKSIHGLGTNNVWVGDDRAAWRFDGTKWTKMTIPGSSGLITSIAVTAANDVWLTDGIGIVFRWNGTSFKRMDSGMSNTAYKMYLWAANPNNVWFGGRGILSYRK